jgi:hypothetical protein
MVSRQNSVRLVPDSKDPTGTSSSSLKRLSEGFVASAARIEVDPKE